MRRSTENETGEEFNIRRKFHVEIQEISGRHRCAAVAVGLVQLSLVYHAKLFFVVFKIFRILERIAKEGENVLNGNVEVVVDEQVKLAANAVLLAPPQVADGLESIVEVSVDEVELIRESCTTMDH